MKRTEKSPERPARRRDVSQAEQTVRDADPPALSPREKTRLATEAIRDEDA